MIKAKQSRANCCCCCCCSVPLSYLLHHRHQDGLSNYLDASLMGFAGANCSMMYHNCPLLH